MNLIEVPRYSALPPGGGVEQFIQPKLGHADECASAILKRTSLSSALPRRITVAYPYEVHEHQDRTFTKGVIIEQRITENAVCRS